MTNFKIIKEKYGEKMHDLRFGTEEKCRAYLMLTRWPDGRPECPACGNKHLNYYIATRKTWKCSKTGCKRHFSLTGGTIFESTKIPLTVWFKAIYYFTTETRGLSSCQLAKHLQIEQRSAWFLMHRLRETMKDENEAELEGIVEVDETQIGPEIYYDKRLAALKKRHDKKQKEIHGLSKYKKRVLRGAPAKSGRQKGVTKAMIEEKRLAKEHAGPKTMFEQDIMLLGMIERNGKVILKKLGRSLTCKTKSEIYPLLKKHINSASILMTDQWNLYDDTGKIFSEHHTINHEESFVKGEIHTNTIENVWKHFKKTVDGTFFHMTYQHFDRYLHEFVYRWNRRELGSRILVDDVLPSVEGKRLKYQELISLPKNPYKQAS